MPETRATLVLRSPRVPRLLGGVIAVLSLLSATVQFILYQSSIGALPGLSRFDAGAEASFATYFSALLLLAAALLLAVAADDARRRRSPFRRHWQFLGGVFTVMSIDEVVGLHEGLSEPVRSLLGTSGALYYAWVVPAAVGLVLLALSYVRFLAALPAEARRRVLLAATVYVGGALGIELVGGILAGRFGEHTLGYGLVATLEETLEMVGLVMFLHALLEYLGRRTREVALQLRVR